MDISDDQRPLLQRSSCGLLPPDVSDRRIVILGKTGSGKSSLANTIFGEKLFKTNHTPNSETSKCQAKTKSVNGRSITSIDTPGFFDTDRSEEELKSEIVRCITECAPGPHAFLIVLKVENYTEQEQAVIDKVNEYFSEQVFKYAIVVFTHGDQLPEEWKINDFVRKNKPLSDLVKKCGGRCHVIDNKYWNKNPTSEYRSNKFQVEELLKTVDKMVEKNGSCYTNEMLQVVEQEIEQDMKLIRQSSPNMSETEVREQAKARVFKKFMIKLAGTGTGVLLGALFGVGVMVGVVLKVLRSLPAVISSRVAAVAGAAAGGAAAVAGAAAAGGAAAEGAAAVAGAAAVGGAAAEGAAAVAGAAAVGGAAAEGGAAAVGGATAVAGGAQITAIVFGTVAAGAAVAGGVIGGVKGYNAAEEADTPWEAVKRAAEAVKDEAKSALDKTQDALDRLSLQTNHQRL